jgi:hypothetical protein
VALIVLFLGMNYRAYDGYFQDDELDNLSWAPSQTMHEYAVAFLKPTFDASNFRPVGHLYFTLMGRAFGLDFPPYMTPILAIHLVNALLLFLLMRKLGMGDWHALAGTAFFMLSATAFDAYWKPMYVFDLLCTTFCLASILLFAYRRWVLSFVAFWCAYKAKELAVTLPLALLAYEYWLGQRRFVVLIPFFAVSLSFGLQGLILNPNKDNEYTFRFNVAALKATVPFYAQRFLFIPFSGFLPVALLLVRDRRVWFGLTAMLCSLFTLLFLPGRLFEAYAYLPLACATVALAAASTRIHPKWAGLALLLWFPWNLRDQRAEVRRKLALDDEVADYVQQMAAWSDRNPAIRTFVYSSSPAGFHDWGITGAWNIVHGAVGLRALWHDWPAAGEAMKQESVAFGTWTWDGRRGVLGIHINSPGK